MMSWFVPREPKFFNMFRSAADLAVEGAKELVALIDDLGNVESRVKKIKDIESRADAITYSTVSELHSTFLTPLDRDDMYALTGKLDDIMDYINAASQRFQLFDIRTVTPEVRELANIIATCTEKVRIAIDGLEDMKTSKKTIEVCKEISVLESNADHVMRMGMSKLFRDDIDFKTLIKLKELLDLLESVTDRCKEVAHIIEGIILDHA